MGWGSSKSMTRWLDPSAAGHPVAGSGTGSAVWGSGAETASLGSAGVTSSNGSGLVTTQESSRLCRYASTAIAAATTTAAMPISLMRLRVAYCFAATSSAAMRCWRFWRWRSRLGVLIRSLEDGEQPHGQ